MSTQVQIIGVYKVNFENIEEECVESWEIAYLVEMFIKDVKQFVFDEIEITQERNNDSNPLHWQVAYDEQFLNENGTEIIDKEIAEKQSNIRFVFFFHDGDGDMFDKPLKTSFGNIVLPKPQPQFPERLKGKIKYWM